jgi:hypothetical protein
VLALHKHSSLIQQWGVVILRPPRYGLLICKLHTYIPAARRAR